MTNYYETLGVSQKASRAEIRSAYRRLARRLHPDLNQNSEEAAVKFAAIAEAYEVLGDSRERARYDQKLMHATASAANGNSIFDSDNPHIRRWRQMVYEKRYNEIIDRMIAEERRESIARERAIYPVVALFVSTLFVVAFKPKLFVNSEMIGKTIVVALFIAGVIHLIGRIRDAFDRFTYDEHEIHESILDEEEPKVKPYTRLSAAAFLIGGLAACLLLGLLIGSYVNILSESMPSMFSETLKPEFVFYPPIVVLFVDLMHGIVSGFEA
ncbi:MAG: J domain-containing protein [Pyrinomonadaceae bacterium]